MVETQQKLYRYQDASGQNFDYGDPTLNADAIRSRGLKFVDQGGQTDPLATGNSRYTTPSTGGSPSVKSVAGDMFKEGGALSDLKPYTASEEQALREKETQRIQASIDAINSSYLKTRNTALINNENRSGRGRATLAASGQIGSASGNAVEDNISQMNAEDLRILEDEKNSKIASLYTTANDRADQLIKQRKIDAGKNSETYLNYLSGVAEAAKADLKNIATSGVTYDDLAKRDSIGLQQLLDQTGMSESAARALFIASAPQGTYLNKDKPEIVNGKAVFFKQSRDPQTGQMKITSETVDLPEGMSKIDPKDIDIVPRDDGIYVVNKVDGTFKKIGQPNPKKGTGDGEDAFAGGEVPFQATIENAASFEGSVTGVSRTQKELANLAKTGDWRSLLIRVQNQAKKGMAAADKTEVTKAEKQVKAADRMAKALSDFEAAGGDMGYFKGKADKIATRLGQLATDPKFKSLATELTAAFQQYRSDMTGAAFGAQESAEYAQVVPTSDKNLNLNQAIITGLRNYMQGKVDDSYSTALGEGYANIKSKIDAGGTGGGSLKDRAVAGGYDYDAMRAQGYDDATIEKALKDAGL